MIPAQLKLGNYWIEALDYQPEKLSPSLGHEPPWLETLSKSYFLGSTKFLGISSRVCSGSLRDDHRVCKVPPGLALLGPPQETHHWLMPVEIVSSVQP